MKMILVTATLATIAADHATATTTFAACRGNATTGLRVYQIENTTDGLALHMMDDGPAEDDGRRQHRSRRLG
jgi:hypothetical protein